MQTAAFLPNSPATKALREQKTSEVLDSLEARHSDNLPELFSNLGFGLWTSRSEDTKCAELTGSHYGSMRLPGDQAGL